METLAEYLDRMMRQMNLSAKELAKRCGLTDSYIGRLCKGTNANLTADTIKKLALAFGVNPHEIFTVVSGVPVSQTPQIDALLLLDQMLKLIRDANGLEALQQLSGFSSDERQRLLDYIAYFKQPPSKIKGKSRKKGKPRKK